MIRNIQVPTGNICVINGDKGPIEFLSIGDYGKNANIKADFLGITRELNGVPNSEIMPLSEKWVVTISTQYGCSQNCIFCDVPKVGKGINATYNDLTNQVIKALELHPEITYTKRLNLHYARMGEPSLNVNVLTHATNLKEIIKPYLGNSLVHPVVSTMLPNRNKHLNSFINEWVDIKNNHYNGDAGLQFSINSTDDNQRNHLFSNNSLSLKEISDIGNKLDNPKGRKYALNFALADDSIINANDLVNLFDPSKFMVKLTPLHQTKACEDNGIRTSNGYQSFTPYKEVEENLKRVGYDVIVFVPSYDEDLGLITCGNAILSGSVPKVKYTELRLNK
jgi:23S rRNA (adenine2503-C2)-methyltransferase